MASSPPTSYSKDEEGGTFIAASQRPDGSWRKPRRVKDGYVPQEEVPLYESKGRKFTKQAPQYPVGLDPALIKAAEARKEKAARAATTKISPIPGLVLDLSNGPKSKKKQKKVDTIDEVTNGLSKVKVNKKEPTQKGNVSQKDSNQKTKATAQKGNVSQKDSNQKTKATAQKEPESMPADPTKRIKNLRKRLREIEAIEQKITSGELKTLEKDQVDKVARKKDVLKEMEEIESMMVEDPITLV